MDDNRMNMFNNGRKKKVIAFIRHIQVLGLQSTDRMVAGFNETERELIQRFTTDAIQLIDYNECEIALENLLANLYEIEFKIDRTAFDLARYAIDACRLSHDELKLLETLIK